MASNLLSEIGLALRKVGRESSRDAFAEQALIDQKADEESAALQEEMKLRLNNGLAAIKSGNITDPQAIKEIVAASEKFGLLPSGSGFQAEQSDNGITLSPGQVRFNSNGEEIASVPAKPDFLSDEAEQQKIRIANASKKDPKQEAAEKPLSVNDLLKFQDKDGNRPEIGTTAAEIKEGGFILKSTAQQKRDVDTKKAVDTVKRLSELTKKVFTEAGEIRQAVQSNSVTGVADRVFTDISNTFKRASQSDKNLVLFESLSNGSLPSILRALGEKGVLSDQDITRALSLIPKTGDGVLSLPDTRKVALGKIEQLTHLIDGKLGNSSVVSTEGDGDLTAEEQAELEALRNDR